MARQPIEITTLRGRLKAAGGIRYWSLRNYASARELHQLHVTFKVLFRAVAQPYDEIDQELKQEGWLAKNEDLIDIILHSDPQDLRRGPVAWMPETENRQIRSREYEPQSPDDMIPLHLHI